VDLLDKVRENRVRRMAYRQLLRLERIRRRDPDAPDFGGYALLNAEGAVILGGAGLDCASLAQVEAFLKDHTTRPRYVRGPDGAFHWHGEPRASLSDFDPAIDGIYGREMVESMRERLHNAVLEVERRREDVARLEQRNAYLEGELKLQERHNTDTLKEVVTLKQKLAKKKPAKRR
jgi:hypothetical protein